MDSRLPKPRKELSADPLFAVIRKEFDRVTDPRPGSPSIRIGDVLMAAFGMFVLKDKSLLAFDQRRDEPNLKAILKIDRIPSDTTMREILDLVDPQEVRRLFPRVFRCLQRGKGLEEFVYWNDCYLLSLDGTEYFKSSKIHCAACQEKHSQTGEVTYSHAAVGTVIVHPDRREVIPLCPEPIIRQDGVTKNDCERNATRRQLAHIRREHPHLEFIAVEDGLSSNGPHVEDLMNSRMHFILGAKPGDHAFLFQQALEALETDRGLTLETIDPETGIQRSYSAVAGLSLNESHPDLLVNFVSCTVCVKGKCTNFSWVTDLPVTPVRKMLPLIERGGRARWKIENETFNTLKNQGYHFEHNYGHGFKNLSTVLMMLMMLAFLVDQVQQIACPLFRAALLKNKCRQRFWETMRSLVFAFSFQSMEELYKTMLSGHVRLSPPLPCDTSDGDIVASFCRTTTYPPARASGD